MHLDAALIELLGLDPDKSTVSSHGGSSFSSTARIHAVLNDGSRKQFFAKTGKGHEAEVMFRGEHESLNALALVDPTLCPRSHGHGQYRSSPSTYFLVTDFMDMSRASSSTGRSLASKLAKLHTTPAPVPAGFDEPQYGFSVTTCCGSTPQDNTFNPSWAAFYAQRLRSLLAQAEANHRVPASLRDVLNKTITTIIPRLLGELSIRPVLVHGDLWSGNHSIARLPSMPDGTVEDVVYDPSCCYAHSEFDLGIMRMFGGFGPSFMREYHALCPKTEPVDEYDDRVKLYESYHHLNHYVMFGGSYARSAQALMEGLLAKYG